MIKLIYLLSLLTLISSFILLFSGLIEIAVIGMILFVIFIIIGSHLTFLKYK